MSWEQPDGNTTIFHLRQGVLWHDLPPVNGREFVADEVVYHFQRIYPHSYGGRDQGRRSGA